MRLIKKKEDENEDYYGEGLNQEDFLLEYRSTGGGFSGLF